MIALLATLGVLVLVVFGTLWRGFVFMKLWAWFAVPAFGFAPLTMVLAMGVALIVSFLTVQFPYEKIPDEERLHRWAHACFVATIWPAVALFIGWVLTFFM